MNKLPSKARASEPIEQSEQSAEATIKPTQTPESIEQPATVNEKQVVESLDIVEKTIVVPMVLANEDGRYQSRVQISSVDMRNMSNSHRKTLSQMLRALQGQELENGVAIKTPSHVVKWMLEQVAK